jgi:hypothetical protein
VALDQPKYPIEEIVARAEALYEREIRDKVEPQNIGKYLAIDIESGAYEIDDDERMVIKKASANHPGGVFHLMRIGFRTLGRIGARAKRTGA